MEQVALQKSKAAKWLYKRLEEFKRNAQDEMYELKHGECVLVKHR